jgi:hypothetical protein
MLDRLLSRAAAVQRYRVARHYVSGRVVDAACGCGYGSWILSKCPAVTSVVGFDRDQDSVEYAKQQYPEAQFHTSDLCSAPFETYLQVQRPDTVVSLETIEHLPDGEMFLHAIRHSGAKRFIVTFPSFETVTFNPYHLKDWTPEEMADAMGVDPVKAVCLDDSVWLMVFDL